MLDTPLFLFFSSPPLSLGTSISHTSVPACTPHATPCILFSCRFCVILDASTWKLVEALLISGSTRQVPPHRVTVAWRGRGLWASCLIPRTREALPSLPVFTVTSPAFDIFRGSSSSSQEPRTLILNSGFTWRRLQLPPNPFRPTLLATPGPLSFSLVLRLTHSVNRLLYFAPKVINDPPECGIGD